MLKFADNQPVYDADEACIVFTGFGRQGLVDCHVTKAAILERSGLTHADEAKLLAAFAKHRLFFEDIACVLSVRGLDGPVLIDETHLSESAFASWRPSGSAAARKVAANAPARATPARMPVPHVA
jgi:hypothetical protein